MIPFSLSVAMALGSGHLPVWYPMIAALSTSHDSFKPNASISLLKTASAIGERQIFPVK